MFDLIQHLTPLPTKGYSLDLLFAEQSFVTISDTPLDLLKTDDHHVSSLVYVNTSLSTSASLIPFKDFKNADYDKINNVLENVVWNDLLDTNDLDLSVNRFCQVINDVITDHVPIKRVKPRSYPLWYDSEIRKLINSKLEAHSIYKASLLKSNLDPLCPIKQNQALMDYIHFKKLRAQVIRMSRVKYKEYLVSIESDIRLNSKRFWSYLKNMKKHPEIPLNMNYNSLSSTDDIIISDFFADYFHSNFAVNNNSLDQYSGASRRSLIFSSITDAQLDEAFTKLKITSSSGPDGIPSYFINKCWHILKEPLLKIFNLSLNVGAFPQAWKLSYILPIHKKGSRNEVTNYRPISILNHFAKLLDSIIATKISDYIFNDISLAQHGYLKNRSTVTNLLTFTNYLHDSFCNSAQTDVVYLDFSKAFDVIDHSLLMNKLWNSGIHGNVYYLIKSYLSNRYQSVRLRNSCSEFKEVPSGVPQGSNLGPILFAIFINDMNSIISYIQILFYADDVKCFIRINDFIDVLKLQSDINNIYSWSLRNGLKLNLQKCCVMSYEKSDRITPFVYCIDQTNLTRVSFIEDLGVTFDSRLKFDKHIEIVLSKASRMLGFVRRNTKEFKEVSTIIVLYKSLVLPYLLYACQVWSPSLIGQWKLLESLQHTLVRYLSCKIGRPMSFIDHNYTPLMTRFKLPTISQLFHYHDYLLAYKLFYNIISLPGCTNIYIIRTLNYNLRRPRIYQEFRNTTRENQNATINRIRRLWNLIDASVRELPINSFKLRMKNLIYNF